MYNSLKKGGVILFFVVILSLFFINGVAAKQKISLKVPSVVENVSTLYNFTINNSDSGVGSNISQVLIRLDSFDFEMVFGTNDSDSNSNFENLTNEDYIYLNWSNYASPVIESGDTKSFLVNLTGIISGFLDIGVSVVNGSGLIILPDISIEIKSRCDGLDNSTCISTSGCALDDEFEICGPACDSYDSMEDCEDIGGGYCIWDDMSPEGPECMFMPFSMDTFGCGIDDPIDCENEQNCTWEAMANMCIVDCFQFDSHSGGNESTCNNAYGGNICEWDADWFCKDNPDAPGCEDDPGICDPFFFDKGFEGFSPCFEFDGNKSGCTSLSEDCVWFSEPNCPEGDWCWDAITSDHGFCDPLGGFDFGGDFQCWLHDGNKNACNDAIEQSQWPCSWSPDSWGPLVNGTESGWCNKMFGGFGGGGDNGGGSCWDYNNEPDCGSAVGLGLPCEWKNSTGATCKDTGCWDYWQSDECIAHQNESCLWNSEYNYCYETNCWDLINESGCDSSYNDYGIDCDWKNNTWGEGGQCEENGCWNRDWTNDTYCEAKAGCSWDGSHCQEKGCYDFSSQGDCTNKTLTGVSCRWDDSTEGWCEQQGCWSYERTNQSACENLTATLGLNCQWENSTGWENCFEQIKDCTDIDNQFECFGTNWCSWDGNNCSEPQFQQNNFWNPGCWIFDQAGEAKCSNVTTCTWGGNACDDNGADANQGVQCGDINNSVMCNGIPMLSSCCQWNGTGCQDAPMIQTCHDLQKPPEGANFCEDYNSKYSQTLCEQIAGDPWYMPCDWDNSTEECRFAGDNLFGGNAGDFEMGDIGSKGNCEATGGNWKEEKYTDSMGNVFFDKWCEPKFGFDSQFCDDSCWACEEQNNGTSWNTLSGARSACEQSNAGCEFYADNNSWNVYGWCDMNWQKQGNCDDNCWECWESDQCSDSAKGCKWFIDPWDDDYGWCDDKNIKTCDDDCFNCWDQQNCQASSVGCSWNADTYFCQPSGTGENGESYEICFDGIDNDNDNFFDCADPECMFNAFCGGSNVFGSDCLSIPDNSTCLNESKHVGYNCTWVTDNWGNSWCDMPGAQCWTQDDNETACNDEIGCQYQTMEQFGNENEEICDINFSVMDNSQCWNYGQNESSCNAQSGCSWQTDKWCVDNPSDPWCVSQNSTNGFMPGWCDHELWSCHNYNDDMDACNAADACGWQEDWWCSSEEGQDDPWCATSPGWCDPVCFSRDSGSCGGNVTIDGINTSGICQLLNASEMGWCEPENMFKGCWDYDDNETECDLHNESCVWIEDNYVPGGGFCGDQFMQQMTGNMDKSEPHYLLSEDCFDDGQNATRDICEIGIKDNPETIALVTRVFNLDESAYCNNSFEFDNTFNSNKSTRFHWYLDTDGTNTGGCSATDNSSIVGLEFKFKHTVIYSDGEISETKVAYKCINGTWSPSQIKTNTKPEKMCYMIGGGLLAIDKADIEKLNGYVDTSADMRVYVATGSETNPHDTAGPLWYTPNTADFKFEDCSGLSDTDGDGFIPSDDPDCIDFFRNGYIDIEKGSQCDDDIDNDGNNLVDCEDSGCMYDSYYCETTDWEDDTTAPKTTWMEVEPFMDGVFVGVDTNEPTNATLILYKNDSYCSNISNAIIIYDWKLNNSFDLDDYDFWHDFPIENTSLEILSNGYFFGTNTTHYFKLNLCDKSSNCALSACTSFTTTTNISEYRVGFDLPPTGSNVSAPMGKVEVQFDWERDGAFEDSIDGEEGFRINETWGRDVDLKFHNPNATLPWGIDFKGADFIKAQDMDITEAFIVNTTDSDGDPFVGMDSEKWEEMVQALGVDEVEIVIPQEIGTVANAHLMHCPNNISELTLAQGCIELDLDDVNCTITTTNTTCKIPTSIGFSVFGVTEVTPSNNNDDSGSSSGGGSGGGGGGGGGGAGLALKFTLSDEQFSAGFKKQLKAGDLMKFMVQAEYHQMVVHKVQANNVIVNVSSELQQATLTIGETRKFELTGDNIYDLMVTLNSIDNATNANISVQSISEEMSAEEVIADKKESDATTTGTEPNAGDITNEPSTTSDDKKSLLWLWILIGIVVIVIVIVVIMSLRGDKEIKSLNKPIKKK